jgi:hypothetical protein
MLGSRALALGSKRPDGAAGHNGSRGGDNYILIVIGQSRDWSR